MKQRINDLAQMVKKGEMWFETTPVEYDKFDLLMDPIPMQAKRVYEYVTNQTPNILEQSALTGYFRFDGSVEGDIFTRSGHQTFDKLFNNLYLKDIDNLFCMEWQHAMGNFKRTIDIGIDGIKEQIEESKKVHREKEELQFLDGLMTVCDTIIAWANRCADFALSKSEETNNEEYKNNLKRLSKTLREIPQRPCETFYEAVLCIYICYPFMPDSIGLIDRQLYSFYKNDIENGTLTKDDAKAYLQELFLMLQAKIHIDDNRFFRGGESHFCVGGYLPDGSDGFNELTYLILESLMELPTAIPQISIRWTEKTPREALRYAMDCERKDTYKRVAFVNDEPRIKALCSIAEFPFETAVNYTMTGCNEPVMTGGRILGAGQQNILRCMANTFKNRADDIIKAKSFDEFYKVYERELFSDIDEMVRFDNKFASAMARDCNLVSSIFLDGCIENAKSATQGGNTIGTPVLDFIGMPNSIDCLAIVKQFVYDEKRVSMEELTNALNSNWQGYEELRNEILKRGHFFGNDSDITTEISQRFTSSIFKSLENKRHIYGRRFLVGNLIGYYEHHKWFGEKTSATPDGRYDGEPLSFGIGQSDGKDREGLTALLNSVAKYDPNHIMTGPSVTNVLLDERLINDDANFEKLVYVFETYFKNGGTHFQLTYVSKEDLIAAKAEPDKYKMLRVRVSGFSDFFVNLNDALQDEIILRTVKKG